LPFIAVALTGTLLVVKDSLSEVWPPGWSDPWPIIYEIHRSLVAGWAGKLLISTLGLGLWAMVWSGRRARVRLRKQKSSRHALIGLSLGIPLAVVGSLGAVLNYVEPLSAWLDPIPAPSVSFDKFEHAPRNSPFDRRAELAAAATAARAHDPRELVKIYPPKESRPYLIFYYRDNTRLYIDPATATLLKTRSSWSHWTSALLPLHALRPLGVFGKVLMLLLAAALFFLATRGLFKLGQQTRRLKELAPKVTASLFQSHVMRRRKGRPHRMDAW
jgi:uncharacterized iron-regulated membrane protein